jgi:hypothetical protein
MQDQRNEADVGMRPDASGQTVLDQTNFDFIFEHPKATLDIRPCPIPSHHLGWCEVSRKST